MPSIRLFISHSARTDPAAKSLIERLHRELSAPDLEVLIDSKALEAGEDWHDALIDWMLDCHGAVLLLSQTALRSNWVEREAFLLNQRKKQDPQFELLPVYLAGVDDKVLAQSRLADLSLPRLQALPGGDVETLIRTLRERCEGLKLRWATMNPGLRLLRDVAAELEQGDEFGLQHLADDLEHRIRQWLWSRRRQLALTLAVRMAEVGLEVVVRALERVASHYELRQAFAMVDRLAALRVSPAAAGRMAEIASHRRPALGVLLNAADEEIARLYARRALGWMPEARFIPLTNSDEGQGAQRLRQEILDAIIDFARADDLAEAQEQLTYEGPPHFVIFPGRRPDPSVLQDVVSLFPTITFCCLAGLQATESDTVLELLHPPLGPGDEAGLLTPYRRGYKQLDKVWEALSPTRRRIP